MDQDDTAKREKVDLDLDHVELEQTDIGQITAEGLNNGKPQQNGANGNVSSGLYHGRIKFTGDQNDDVPGRMAEFVKISATTEPKEVIGFMREVWRIETPEVLIAVTGGAKDFPLKGQCREFFRRKLIGKALNTGAWIVSGGTYFGVMKHVGEAVIDYGQRASHMDGIAIGVATWNMLYNKTEILDHLQKGSPDSCFVYHVTERKSLPKNTSCLDPNHTHFILVDSGKDEFGGEVDFRNDFIDYLSKQSRVKFNVCVLLEGGFQSLKTIQIAASVGTPVVVIGGTGRLAKVLCEVFDADALKKPWIESVRKEADSILGFARNSVDPSEVVDIIFKCLQFKNKFSFCRIGDDSYLQGKLIGALLRDSEVGWEDQMKLAMMWNRPDIAKGILQDENSGWEPDDLFLFFIDAVCDNKVHFVRLFLEHRVTVYNRLNLDEVKKIYSRVEKNSFLDKLLVSKRVVSTHPAYGILDNYLKVSYPNEMGDVFQELFIYSVLSNQMEMAEVFWGYSKEPLAAALTATSLLQAMSSSYRNFGKFPDECVDMAKSAKRMEELAVGLLDECRDDNLGYTSRILTAHRPNWGSSCFKIGLTGCAKLEFASHNSVQNILDELWSGDISHMSNKGYAITMASFCPVLLLMKDFITFKVEEEDDQDTEERRKTRTRKRHQNVEVSETDGHDDEYIKLGTADEEPGHPKENGREGSANESCAETVTDTEKHLPFCDRLIRFYTRSPLVKFRLHWVSYIVFLLYMSYVMLFQFHDDVTVYEMILIFWVATFFCEEIRQMIDADGADWRRKLEVYINEPWNKIDLASHSLFFLGILFRCFPSVLLDAARTLLCLSLIVFYVKLLHIFLRFKKVGPKLLMIGRMILDLLLFVGIMAVFLLAYGVASQAILYPNLTTNMADAVRHVLLKSYFQIFGELFLDMIYGEAGCTHNSTLIAEGQTACPENTWTGIVLLGGYMLISNVLLLNLLIAMFSYTFEQVQENTDALWKYHRYELILEYERKPMLVPPFIILPLLFRLIRYISKRTYKYIERTEVTLSWDLMQWEKLMLEYYLAKLNKEAAGDLSTQLKLLNERFDLLERLVANQQAYELSPCSPRLRQSFSVSLLK